MSGGNQLFTIFPDFFSSAGVKLILIKRFSALIKITGGFFFGGGGLFLI